MGLEHIIAGDSSNFCAGTRDERDMILNDYK